MPLTLPMPARHRFAPGSIVATPTALAVTTPQQILESIERHLTGDWGDVTPEDAQANEDAVTNDHRVFSVYQMSDGNRLWIITEANRVSTCILLPSDY